ncbi:acyl-CoA-binding domain-containing protein 6-like [Rhinatrema bivittatum]|uniref:acyl-CoA-binding domain-containing protein 6-like n=1 Tax=Rhinatrema bivittatum TaxID=194408 RepID=UPI001129E7A0|nr:acyl-CoA-binding domain-containing protein 6-like [Rhinatrema bivittatum]XP_029474120.1 acyl-CoA-binding domain-containing protein 6-like [Rhinatrema bivittatum]XP_029474130.1 acyl-CoA-binding domain-containing protein 6-like [Rhinatrema bivittatum]XP_029474139.1 acyl-CoA-binding domain-containing protein 6-like [Rhinatrema bivittatum]
MALASGHWIRKDVTGDPPSPRHGHALAVAGNIAFVFGGYATHNTKDEPTYFNDFYMLTVTPADLTWEVIPQEGNIPSPREGHSICIVKEKIYLFGGNSNQDAEECLPGMYCFDLGSLTWHKLKTNGIAPRTLRHSSTVVGENIFFFGGRQCGTVVEDLYMFNPVSFSWIPVKTTGLLPEARSGHTLATVGDQIYLFGGCTEKNIYKTDVHVLDTVTLVWQLCEVKGETPSGRTHHSFTAHHDKDIYLFGGVCECQDGNRTLKNDVVKLSLAKMKWKVPLYVGIPPACRHSHAAFILHSHLFIFGGVNEEHNFNDIIGMKLINPSERKPIMKEILSEFGIQGVSNGFIPTKIPKVKYELSSSPFPARMDSPLPITATPHQYFISVRNEAMDKITRAFALLDSEFEELDTEKAKLVQAKIAFQKEKEFYSKQYKDQQQELQEMLEKHKTQNELWLKARAEENDKERKEICKLREELLHDQEKLREEQQSIDKRNQQLISIMQQFKGM